MEDKQSVANTQLSPTDSSVSSRTGIVPPPKAPWWAFFWDYEPGRTKEETAFVQRLDIFLLTLLCLGYFIKNLDQTNIANAYVSGMKEDLQMHANELNLIDVAWTVGYVIGQIPSQLILTKVRPSVWLPSCELVWVILTFTLAAAKTSNQVIAIRFFIGLSEGTFYPAAHMILGSWYRPSELGKRACIFHASSAAAGMFSGYLQAGLYKGLNGRHGLAGWQWLFVMDGIISLPITAAGFFLIPDLPENTRAPYLKPHHVSLAQKRMSSIGRAARRPLALATFTRIFSRWHVYLLVVLYILFINCSPSSSVNPLSLWLKSQPEKYSVELVNIIPTSQSAVQLVTTVGFAFLSDFYRSRAGVICFSASLGCLSCVLLLIWTIPTGLKWFAYEISRAYVVLGPLSMAWANEICGSDAEERAIVLGLMNAGGYAVNAWLPYLTYPASEAPVFRKGFAASVGILVALIGVVWAIWWMHRRERKQKAEDGETILQDHVGESNAEP